MSIFPHDKNIAGDGTGREEYKSTNELFQAEMKRLKERREIRDRLSTKDLLLEVDAKLDQVILLLNQAH